MARPGNADDARSRTEEEVIGYICLRAVCYGLLLTEEASPSPPDLLVPCIQAVSE